MWLFKNKKKVVIGLKEYGKYLGISDLQNVHVFAQVQAEVWNGLVFV